MGRHGSRSHAGRSSHGGRNSRGGRNNHSSSRAGRSRAGHSHGGRSHVGQNHHHAGPMHHHDGSIHHHHTRGHSSSPYDAELEHAQQMLLLNNAVYVLRSAGEDGPVGCPRICPVETITCSVNTEVLPNELNGIMTNEELLEFTAALNQVFNQTHWPILPCIFTHFCIPFSPLCAFAYCANERNNQVAAIIGSTNTKLAERGYHWESVQVPGVIALLQVNTPPPAAAAAAAQNQATSSGDGGMAGDYPMTITTAEVVYATVISSSTEVSAPPPVTEMVMVRHVEADNSTDK